MPYKDPERRRDYGREWMKRNPEKAREGMRRWRSAHRDVKRERDRLYRAAHPEIVRAQTRRYRRKHPEVKRGIDARRRARIVGAPGHFTAAEWAQLVTAWGGRCAYCGAEGPLEPDHRVPLARGGSNDIGNILPACGSCNRRKHAMSERAFRTRLANERWRSADFEVIDWWGPDEIHSIS